MILTVYLNIYTGLCLFISGIGRNYSSVLISSKGITRIAGLLKADGYVLNDWVKQDNSQLKLDLDE